jgi:chromosome segregation ATPase
MNKSILYLNFLGVLVLGVICYLQYQLTARQHEQIDQLNINLGQSHSTIDDREKTIGSDLSQIADLHLKLDQANKALADKSTEFAQLADERDQIAQERDKVVAELQKWQDAVGQRDATIKAANASIASLTSDRDDAVAKYNDLAKQYNDVMSQLNALRATTRQQ